MSRRIAFAATLTALIVLASATPALAVSSIRNELTVNSAGLYVRSGERTSWAATTSYGQYLFQNPYTSDFECLLNARHFSAPRSYRVSGTSSYWRYTSYDSASRGPAWRNYSGTFWVWQPRTVYNRFTAYAKRSGFRRGWQRSALGQHNWSVSRGPTDYQYTYHY
jgi:hypothetical protein